MATYYCIHGATYNGDGTTSAEAAGAGLAGAFNDAIACLDGTQAEIVAGDTVIFKTQVSAADVVIDLTASFVSSDERRFIFDDGTVWVGEAGTFIISFTTASDLSFRVGTQTVIDGGDEYRFEVRNTGGGLDYLLMNDNSFVNGIHLYQFNETDAGPGMHIRSASAYGHLSIGKIKHTFNKISTANTNYGLVGLYNYATLNISDYEVIFQNTALTQNTSGIGLFEYGTVYATNSGVINITNLRITGLCNSILLADNPYVGAILNISNMSIDNIDYAWNCDTFVTVKVGNIKIAGGGYYDFKEMYEGHVSSWHHGKNYPVLNSLLPDGTTKWSIKTDLPSTKLKGQFGKATEVVKFYDQAAGVKTLTVEYLVYDQITDLTGYDFWCDFSYVDTTGVTRCETTRGQALQSSTAPWNTTAYGPLNFTKYKFEVTTSYSVDTDTIIKAVTYSACAAPDATSSYFTDPTIGVS